LKDEVVKSLGLVKTAASVMLHRLRQHFGNRGQGR